MIRLLEVAETHLRDILKVFTHVAQELGADVAFAREQAVQRILVLSCLFRKSFEGLEDVSISQRMTYNQSTYSRQLRQPFTTTFEKRAHPCRLLRRLGFGRSLGDGLVVVVCQHPHFAQLAE